MAVDEPVPSRPRRWRRRLLWSAGIVVGLLLLVIVVVQIVLWTSVPRHIVLRQVERQLGLRVEAASVEAGWFGSTVLTDVAITLPLAQDALLTVPLLEVEHTWLPWIAITRKVDLEALELERPHLEVRQDQTGRWNVQELAEILARAAGKRPAQQGRTTRVPAIQLNEATLVITDRGGRSITIEPVSFAGNPDGSLLWRYEGSIPDLLEIEGEVVPGTPWQHEVALRASNLGPLLQPWIEQVDQPIALAGRWSGRVDEGMLSGRLMLDDATAFGYGATGEVLARLGGATATVQPIDVRVTTPQPLVPTVQLASGTLRREGDAIVADRLQLGAMNGQALIDGRWSSGTNSGRMDAEWSGMQLPGGIRHSGAVEATLETPFPGGPHVSADLRSQGDVGEAGWSTALTVTGAGANWRAMTYDATITQARWRGWPYSISLADITAQVTVQDDLIALTQFRSAGAGDIRGSGRIDLASRLWEFEVDADDVPLEDERMASLDLVSEGSFQRYELRTFGLRLGDIEINAEGSYDRALATDPVALKVNLSQSEEPTPDVTEPITGQFRAETTLTGTANPLDLRLGGTVLARNLAVRERPVGDVAVEIDGRVSRDQQRVWTKDMVLLGGRWGIEATRAANGTVAVRVAVEDLPLEDLGSVASTEVLQGVAQGSADITVPRGQLAHIQGDGEFFLAEVALGKVRAQRGEGRFLLDGNVLRVEDVKLIQEDGTATAGVVIPLDAPRQPVIGFAISNWPVTVADGRATLRLDARSQELRLDAARLAANGPLAADLRITAGEAVLGDVDVALTIDGRVARLDKLSGQLIGGHVDGQGAIDLDIPVQAAATLTWTGIDPSRLAPLNPVFSDVRGQFGLTGRVGPSTDERALGPMRVDAVLDSSGGGFRGLDVGDGTLTAFMDLDPLLGGRERFRVILSNSLEDPTILRIADGIVRFWGRAGELPGGGFHGLVTIDLDRLDLNQLVRGIDPEQEDTPGRLSGTLRLLGDPRRLTEITGDGSLSLAESNLANVFPVRQIYDIMRLLTVPSTPTGEGTAELRLEPNELIIGNLTYFNRGIEIRMPQLTIGQLRDIPQSPLDGVAIGTARPLKDIKLPFINDADRVLAAIQQDATPVGIRGTVDEPDVVSIPFEALGEGVGRLLLGETRDPATQ